MGWFLQRFSHCFSLQGWVIDECLWAHCSPLAFNSWKPVAIGLCFCHKNSWKEGKEKKPNQNNWLSELQSFTLTAFLQNSTKWGWRSLNSGCILLTRLEIMGGLGNLISSPARGFVTHWIQQAMEGRRREGKASKKQHEGNAGEDLVTAAEGKWSSSRRVCISEEDAKYCLWRDEDNCRNISAVSRNTEIWSDPVNKTTSAGVIFQNFNLSLLGRKKKNPAAKPTVKSLYRN